MNTTQQTPSEQQYESSSSPGTFYTAKIAADGKLLCNCRGWTNKRGSNPRHCTHTKQLINGSPVETRGEFVYVVKGATAPKAKVSAPAKVSARPMFAPMLASAQTTTITGKAFDRHYGDGWWMEEKIDGHRCTVVIERGINGKDRRAITITAYSRPRDGKANVRELPEHIVEQLKRFPDGVYDGELVAPGGKAWNVVESGARLVLVLFDVIAAGKCAIVAEPYDVRRRYLLETLAAVLTPTQTAITTVESVMPSWAAIEAIWKRGGEGVILKRAGSLYQCGTRSPEWVKVKQQHAATLTLTGFSEGKSGPCSVMNLRDADGKETTVKVLGNKLLAEVTTAPHRFIGRRVVISYQEKTNTGTYRHGIFDHFAGAGE